MDRVRAARGWHLAPGALLIAIVTGACGGSTSAPSTSAPATLTGSVTDAAGDAVVSAVLRNGGDTLACLLLDTDENPATGSPVVSGEILIGYDYSVCAVNPRRSTTAQVSRLGGGSAVGVGSVPMTFPSDAQMTFTVPLSLLGNDDGRLAFKVQAMQWVDDPGVFNTGTIDLMPDLGRPAGFVR
jgi:hypothetical protein